MDLLDVDLYTALSTVLGTEYTTVSGTLSIHSDFDPHGGYYIAHPDYTLSIVIYYDQKALALNLDLFSITEQKMSELLKETGGYFMGRRVEPFRDNYVCQTIHEIRITDASEFISKLDIYAKKLSDIEFTKALEVKLSED